MTSIQQTILVTDASGPLGRRVVELLLDRKVGTVLAGSRDLDGLSDLAKAGAVLRKVDFDDPPEALAAAFAGVERLLLSSVDADEPVGQRFEQHERAIRAAVAASVKHVTYTSIAHPDPESPVMTAPDHRRTEEALAKSGIPFTALRNNLYMENLLPFLRPAVVQGQLFGSAGETGAAYVSREDCAQAAASAVTMVPTGNATLEVTGPSVVNYTQLARLVSELTGERVTHVPLKGEDRRAELIGAGISLSNADTLVSFDAGMLLGKFGPATAVVRQLTGRAPTSVREFLLSNKKALSADA